MPWDADETTETYVGRIREDLSHPKGLTFWVVADQLYKGAALNSLQIAEVLEAGNLLGLTDLKPFYFYCRF